MFETRSSCVQSDFPDLIFLIIFYLPFSVALYISEPEYFYGHQRKAKCWYHLTWAPGVFFNQSSEMHNLKTEQLFSVSSPSAHKQYHSRCTERCQLFTHNGGCKAIKGFNSFRNEWNNSWCKQAYKWLMILFITFFKISKPRHDNIQYPLKYLIAIIIWIRKVSMIT